MHWVHQNRASPFASDFHRWRGCRREFRSEDRFYPFSSQKKSRFASDFLRRGNRAAWGLKNRAMFWGAVKIAAAAAENRSILVHSGDAHSPLYIAAFFVKSALGLQRFEKHPISLLGEEKIRLRLWLTLHLQLLACRLWLRLCIQD